VIDFHTHTFFSDGVLNPSELVRRAHVLGYRAIGLTDHVDASNLDFVVPRILEVAKGLNKHQDTYVIPGLEITHAPPGQIPELVNRARDFGPVLVVVHGETPTEPVQKGTNRAAIESQADILAHPGYLTEEDAQLAARNDVALEITYRGGHNITNGHVARMAKIAGARLVINTDTHSPDNLITRETALKVIIGAGLTGEEAYQVLKNNEDLLNQLKTRINTTEGMK
jgi:histidinol phosphatase-like PHP family hydrolase